MRKLRIQVTRTPGAAPVLLTAIVVPLLGCDGDDPDGSGGASTSAAQTTSATSSGETATTTSFSGPSSTASTGAGGGLECPGGFPPRTFDVELPPPGTPADPGQICVAVTDPVESTASARVTLMVGAEPHLATGFVSIPSEIEGSVVGLPTVEAIEATTPELLPVAIADVAPMPGGYTFDATFPEPFTADPRAWARVTFRVTFTIDCTPSPAKTVQSTTFVQLCDELGGSMLWVSSGDECNVCSIIAEMAPSPIVPERRPDDIGLAHAVRLRVVEVARVGRARVLLAENDGGDGMTYRWQASSGTVTELAPDIVLWEPPSGPGPHQVQAAVLGEDGAAVSSFVLKEVA